MKEKVIAIVGPTAVGKTALSIALAQQLNGEVISGDSLQVYKHLDIGTAKATKEEQASAPHHLIDIREIEENYDVFQFQQEARKLITEITSRGKVPIICGGTGLYIQSLLEDYSLGGTQVEDGQKEKFEKILEIQGKHALWEKLAEVDPKASQSIHENNSRKVMRALIVYEMTGKSIIQADGTDDLSVYQAKIIGLNTERTLLYERINQRVDIMMDLGVVEEAKLLFDKYPTAQATQGIGYKEFFPYFQGEISIEEAVDLVKQHSRNYAKRQLTWFRNRMDTQWLDLVTKPEAMDDLIKDLRLWIDTK